MKWTFIILIFLFSCNQSLPDKNVLTEKYYQAKRDAFLLKKENECKKEIQELAESQLDSVIDQYIKDRLLDSIAFPAKPYKPNKPPHILDKVQRFEISKTEN